MTCCENGPPHRLPALIRTDVGTGVGAQTTPTCPVTVKVRVVPGENTTGLPVQTYCEPPICPTGPSVKLNGWSATPLTSTGETESVTDRFVIVAEPVFVTMTWYRTA